MGKVIGIDLGTTNSVMAIHGNSEIKIISNSRGNRITPSVIAVSKKGEIIVGETARNQAVINSDNTVIGIKRKMGEKKPILLNKKEYMPQVISSFLLTKMKKDAEKYLGDKVTDAVITVPAYFSDSQRQATVDAGKIAGLNVLRIINEPTAAALAYGLNKQENQMILVYDLGGGTFDVSILELDNGVFEVISTKGNNKLGGLDFDKELSDVVIKQFEKETGIDISKDKLAIQKLNEEVEKAKINLSDFLGTEINIPFISADKDGPKHLEFEISRSEFEIIIEKYIDQTIELTKMALEDGNLTIDDIDKIILVGGSTRIPLVVNKIEKFMKKKVYEGIDPDEVVAKGAAIQTAIIKGDIKGVVLVDVTPLSLGIEVEGGVFVPIIKRNNAIPTSEKKIFTTTIDDQDEVEVHVLQGERKLVNENISLGKFILSDIRKAKKGVPRIEVTFDIDVNSIVHVTAKDIDTGKKQEVEINAKVGFSKEEIDILINDAKRNEKYDDEIITFSKLKNEVKGLILKINNICNEKKVNKNFLKEIDNLIDDTNKALDTLKINDIEKNIKIFKDFYEELEISLKNENKESVLVK